MESNDRVRQNVNTEMVIKVIAGLAAVLYSLRTLQASGNTIGYVISLFTAHYKISYIFSLLGSVLALISCMVISLTLVLFVLRRTRDNTEYMFLTVSAAGVIRVAAVFLRMILIYAGRIVRGSYFTAGPIMTFVKETIYVAIVICVLFAILNMEGSLAYVKRSKDELAKMFKNLPDFIKTEINIVLNEPETVTEATKMRTDRSYLVILLLGLITGGIYLYYVYYKMTKDLNVICSGDGRVTVGIVPHILLDIATIGIFEFYWQYSVAERMARISPQYHLNIKENGKTILILMIAGMFIFFLGTYFAMYLQIRNLNRLSESYNQKMFGNI